MNILLSGQPATIAIYIVLLTAIGTLLGYIVKGLSAFASSFGDLMKTLREDNKELREALNNAETNRMQLADELVTVHREVAKTIDASTELATRLHGVEQQLVNYKEINEKLLGQIKTLQEELAECKRINLDLMQQIDSLQKQLHPTNS